MTGSVTLLRALYRATAEAQAAALPDIGDGLAAQMARLAMDPTPSACEVMAANLEGARQAVLRLRESLMSETPGAA